jgi:RNA polymerase sigma factor (sigma-70 family)
MEPVQVSDLVQRAAEGQRPAWEALIEEFDGLVWSVARSYRLGEAQTADVVQTTWLRLVEHLGAIRDPDRLAGWLATTTRRACLAVLREAGRERPTDSCGERPGSAWAIGFNPEEPGPEVAVLRQDQQVLVRRALATLPERHQALLGLLCSSPPISYEQISAGLGMPVGSIGPTRARILARLRGVLEGAGLCDASLN